MHRVYMSASMQLHNIGVASYGTEQDRMHLLADRVKYWLGTQKGRFVVFRNSKGWTLAQTVKDCNNLACELFVENHSNAGRIEQTAGDGGAEGTEVFYYHQGGTKSPSYRLASLLYKYIAAVSPGKDRGVIPDSSYSGGSLYVIQQTNPPACLIENMFHTNYAEVNDMIANMDKYARAQAMAISEFCGEVWIEVGSSSIFPGKMYTVQNGDSLWSIAEKLLGGGARYPEIKKLNNLYSDNLVPGQTLKIPEK